jgi:hypothetical protein
MKAEKYLRILGESRPRRARLESLFSGHCRSVLWVRQGEGLNFAEQGGAAKLDVAINPIGGAKLSALKCLASAGHRLSEPFV